MNEMKKVGKLRRKKEESTISEKSIDFYEIVLFKYCSHLPFHLFRIIYHS